MVVRALQGLILCLAVVAGIEIGYLSRPSAPEPQVILADSRPLPVAACPSPVARVVVSPEPASPPPDRPPRPIRRGKPARGGPGPIPDAQSVADCAKSGGPLCGMPK